MVCQLTQGGLPGAGTVLADGFTSSCESRAASRAASVEGAVAVMLMRRAATGVRRKVTAGVRWAARHDRGEAAGRSMAVPVDWLWIGVRCAWRDFGLLGGHLRSSLSPTQYLRMHRHMQTLQTVTHSCLRLRHTWGYLRTSLAIRPLSAIAPYKELSTLCDCTLQRSPPTLCALLDMRASPC